MRDEILESLEWFEVMQCPEAFNCIYVWRNKVNGKIYVGKAKKLHKRRNEHLSAKDNYHIHKSLRKRGVEGYQLAIIIKDLLTEEELNENERYYIKVLNSLNKNGKGYNCSDGGEGGNNYAGKTEEEITEIRKKQSEAHKGKKPSEETKQKLSEAKKGEKAHQCRKVICITNGESFDYIKQAEEKYGINHRKIIECCKGKRKSTGIIDGKPAVWVYYSDYEKLSKEEVNKIKNEEMPNGTRPKAVICITTEKTYESATEAERQTGVKQSNITQCCRGKRNSAGKDENGNKLVWMYLDEYLES